MESLENQCCICGESFKAGDGSSVLGQKGVDGIKKVNSSLDVKANKQVLADALWSAVKESQATDPSGEAHFVVDGGALHMLHRVVWPRGLTYDAICLLHIQYVRHRYPSATIVFDGYDYGSTTKDCTHQRRHESGPAVLFASDMVITLKKDVFLSSSANKQKFINLLSQKLRGAGCTTLHATGDTDVMIANTAIAKARECTTILIGDDTDLLLLLLHHGELDARDLFFKPEPRQRDMMRRVWDNTKAKVALVPEVCSSLLFVHALMGCDTTSRVHGIGKGVALKAKMNAHF